MSVEIRAIEPGEMDEFSRVLAYAFAGPPPGAADAVPPPVLPEWTTCAFVDGRIAATTAAYPFKMRLNGAPIGVAGVTAVGAYPEFRRQGLVRRAMKKGLEEQRERGQGLAILWASYAAIYQRFGYGLASASLGYRFDPRLVPFRENPELSGGVGLVAKDDALEQIAPIYKSWSTPRNLMLHRSGLYWQNGVFNAFGPQNPMHTAVYRNGAGEARGYLVYRVQNQELEEPGPSQDMTVRDFVALDIEAYRSLWAYIRRHDLVRWVSMTVPADDPAPDLLLEPRELRTRKGDGVWLRVVDVERALPQRPYGDRGSVVIEIDDELCPWNAGRFQLESDQTESDHTESAQTAAQVKRTERSAQLSMPIRTLASLVSGHATASQLKRAGLLDSHDASALALADRLFATDYPPFCPDGF